MRLLIGAGTPEGAAARVSHWLFFAYTTEAAVIVLLVTNSRPRVAGLTMVMAP